MSIRNDVSILVVDDEEPIRRLLATYLSDEYGCVTAADSQEAMTMLKGGHFNLLLTDITMPGTSGIELCEFVQENCSDTVVIMVSGMTDIQYAIESMRQGAFDYVTKPFDLSLVMMVVHRALRYQALVAAKHYYEQSLEGTVRVRTKELREMNDNLNRMLEALYANYRATLRALAKALEARDVETRGHSDRVVAYSLRLGKEVGLSHNDLIALEQGAILHDIGKIGVPDSILLKRDKLTPEEWIQMREHTSHGMRIIGEIDFLQGARPVVGQHHEKFDGSGYPNSLRGEAIHLHARIFAVADAYDAITSNRPYRAAQSYAAARSEIIASSGTHLDPQVIDAFLTVPEAEWCDMRRTAEACDFIDHMIDKREIGSFIVSLKAQTESSNPYHTASA